MAPLQPLNIDRDECNFKGAPVSYFGATPEAPA